eukprot:TRINITY_DN37397_c0_g1_i1.p1 TRINITY_DN37397_c0_g1~~TRINITY_DN37397_c0_g1_i1.p1  ORF type:complete len:319 (+),score=60.73 TRINITY_DN37397_c0_g1_i1:52-1008(+)
MPTMHKKSDEETGGKGVSGILKLGEHVLKHEGVIVTSVTITIFAAIWFYTGAAIHLVFAIAMWELGRHVRSGACMVSSKFSIDKTGLEFMARLLELACPVTAGYSVLRCLNVISDEVSPQILGACSLTVGLASQSVMSNFASGMVLVIFRPFKAGDFLVLNGCSATIKRIGIFFTHACDLDGNKICLPNNAIISGGAITNWSGETFNIIRLTVKLRSGVKSCSELRQILEQAAAKIDDGAAAILSKYSALSMADRRQTAVLGPVSFTPYGMEWQLEVSSLSSVYNPMRDFGNACLHDTLSEHKVEIFEFNATASPTSS